MTDDLGHSGYKETFLPFGDPDAQDPDPEVRKRFFGVYRGTVVENIDPLQQGRLMVSVADVYGMLPGTWAMPCVPIAGPQMGTSFVPPPIGSSVWVEFEQGDPQMPVWVGCFWGTPFTQGILAHITELVATPAMTLETLTSGIGVSDAPTLIPGGGNISIYAAKGAVSIILNPTGITITAPMVNIMTPKFTVNGAQFTVV
jgi:hypothetical protein